jgi:hypothetical protein
MPEAILLRDAVPPSGAGMLLEPLVLSNQPTIWYGNGGDGKSYMALAAGLSIHTGQALLGIEPTQRLRVALLDWEADAWTHHQRMRALTPDVDLPDLLYVACHGLPLSAQVDRLKAVIDKHQIGFVIVDSVALACDGPPEESGAAMDFFNALHRLQVGSLLIAHVNRSGDPGRPFGSAFWHNMARLTWHFRKGQLAADALIVTLTNHKNNTGPQAKPLSFRLDFTGGQTTISPVGAVAHCDDEPATLRGRLINALRGGALTYDELAERLDAPADTIRRTVARQTSIFTVLKNQRPHRIALLSNETEPDTQPDNKTRQNRTDV